MGVRRMLGKGGGGSCPSYTPGLYTAEEIDTLVNVDGYIPVANATEFDNIRTGASETMGAGTCWEGTYTTGLDKKYIQVFNMDFASFGLWSSSIGTFTGVFDGNELVMDNITGSTPLFATMNGTIENTILSNIDFSGAPSMSALISVMNQGNCLNNKIISGTIDRDNNISSCAGFLQQIESLTGNVLIDSCINYATISAGEQGAGIVSVISGSATFTTNISNCDNYGTITGATGVTTVGVSGIVGNASRAAISNCRNFASASSTSTINGGILGIANIGVTVSDCTNSGDISTGGTYCGGIIGFNENTSASPKTIITNCTNTGDVSGTGTHVSGIACNLTGRMTITGCTNAGDVSGATQFVGGITTYIYNAADTISDCVVENCSISGAGGSNSVRMGGIAYFRLGGIVEDCRVENVSFSNLATGSLATLGGIAGTMFQGVNIIRRCEVINCTIDGGATGDRVGGIVGFSRSGSTSNLVEDCRVISGSINGDNLVGGIWGSMALAVDDIVNSFCAVAVTGNTNVGGLVGLGTGSAVATDSYWDTDIGPATSSKGTGQTTSALQTPTTNSGIYSAWTIPPWDFGTDTEYPTLTTTP